MSLMKKETKREKRSGWLILGLFVLVCALASPAMAQIVLDTVACPATYNAALGSCTANDVVTTIDAIEVLEYNCDDPDPEQQTVSLLINTSYYTTANERYDLGIFVAKDGGSVQGRMGTPGLATTCVGVAPQVGDGVMNFYPDADTDLFLNLDSTGHKTGDPDTCGDLSSPMGPVQIQFTLLDIKCVFDESGQNLAIPACRVWEQNRNHESACHDPGDAGTGSKCDCSPFTVTVPKAYLTLIKYVTNDNGGTKVVADFPLFVDATSVVSGVENEFVPGTYMASETPQAGYSASAWGGDCAANGAVTLAPGDHKTCTITNDDNPPALHLRKVVVNDDGGSALKTDWVLHATGPTSIWGMDPVDSGPTFAAGTYALSETDGPAGYTPSSWVCVGGTQVGSSITVGLGQSATCTITNNDNQAYITVVKVVTNDDGGTALPNDFLLTLEGSGVTSGVAVPVNPGTYTADETLLSGYTFEGYSGDCDSNGDTTVALGESKTCTLTNNDIPQNNWCGLTIGYWKNNVGKYLNDAKGRQVCDEFFSGVDPVDVCEAVTPGECASCDDWQCIYDRLAATNGVENNAIAQMTGAYLTGLAEGEMGDFVINTNLYPPMYEPCTDDPIEVTFELPLCEYPECKEILEEWCGGNICNVGDLWDDITESFATDDLETAHELAGCINEFNDACEWTDDPFTTLQCVTVQLGISSQRESVGKKPIFIELS